MSVVSFTSLTFASASTRWLGPYKGTITEVLGSFGANVKATVTGTFDGESRTGIQIEGSRENTQYYSQQRDQYNINELNIDDDSTAVADPIGGNSSEELVPTTNNAQHYARLITSLHDASWESGRYCVSSFYRGNGYGPLVFSYHVGSHNAIFDPDDNWNLLSSTDINDYGFSIADTYWAQCWMAFDVTYSAPGTVRGGVYVCDADSYSFTGDGSSSIYDWQMQYEKGFFPSSIIPTTSSPVTRSVDNAYWAEGDVVAGLRGVITVYVIPMFSSSALYDESTVKHTVLHFDDATQDIQIYFEAGSSAGTGRIVAYGASALITSGNHTWTEGQLLKIVIDPASGEITTSLFTTGNGTHSGTSWSTDDGNVYLGQSSSNTEQFYGVIFEPEYSGGTTRELTATIAGSSATPDDVVTTTGREFAATVAGASATPDDIVATVARGIATTVVATSSTPDDVVATISRALSTVIAVSSATPDDVVETIARALLTAIAGVSVTPDDVAATSNRALTGAIAVTSETSIPTATIGELRELAATIAVVSATSDVLATVSRVFAAAIAGASETSSIGALTTRVLVGAIPAASETSIPTATIGEIRELSATIAIASVTGDISVTVSRALTTAIGIASETPDVVDATTTRDLLAAIAMSSLISDIASTSTRSLVAGIPSASVTPDIAAITARAIVATITASSVTPDIVATLEGLINLVASIAASSVTPEIAASTLRAIIANLLVASNTPDISIILAYAIRLYNGVQLKSHTPVTDNDLRMWADGEVIGIPVITATDDAAGSIRIRVNDTVKALERAN